MAFNPVKDAISEYLASDLHDKIRSLEAERETIRKLYSKPCRICDERHMPHELVVCERCRMKVCRRCTYSPISKVTGVCNACQAELDAIRVRQEAERRVRAERQEQLRIERETKREIVMPKAHYPAMYWISSGMTPVACASCGDCFGHKDSQTCSQCMRFYCEGCVGYMAAAFTCARCP